MSALGRATTSLLCSPATGAAARAIVRARTTQPKRHSSTHSSTPLVASEHRPPHWSLSDYSSASAAVPVAPISASELAHLCHLSYLAAPAPAEAPKMLADLDGVVRWIGTITTLDMSNHEPLYSPLQLPRYYERAEAVRHNLQQNKPVVAATEAPAASTNPAVSLAESLRDPASPECVRLRSDVVTDGACDKAVLANAPYKQRGFFVVPKVVDLEDS